MGVFTSQELRKGVKSNLQTMNEPTAGLGRSFKNMFDTEKHDTDKLNKIKIHLQQNKHLKDKEIQHQIIQMFYF